MLANKCSVPLLQSTQAKREEAKVGNIVYRGTTEMNVGVQELSLKCFTY